MTENILTTETNPEIEFKNAEFLRNGDIDCEINHPEYGWIPITLSENDNANRHWHEQVKTAALAYKESSEEFNLAVSLAIEKLNLSAEDNVNKVTGKYPEFEKQTFEIQRTEAAAWEADNTVPTPNIDLICMNRYGDLSKRVELIAKVNKKAADFSNLALTIAGKRQKIEDEIKAAKTIAELEAIVVDLTAV